MKVWNTPRLIASLACCGVLISLSVARSQDIKDLNELMTLIKPQSAEEKWAEIPWMSSLWEARRKAAEQGKPILLWEMDGHPLGCT